MSQQHISHHEYERKSELNLELIETCDGPLSEVLGLIGEQDDEHSDSIDQEHVSPKVNVLVRWIVQFVDQNKLKNEDWEHDVELGGVLKESILQNVSKDDDFVKQNEKG